MPTYRIAVAIAGTLDVAGDTKEAALDLLESVVRLRGLKIGSARLRAPAVSLMPVAEVVSTLEAALEHLDKPQPPKGEHHLEVHSVSITPRTTTA